MNRLKHALERRIPRQRVSRYAAVAAALACLAAAQAPSVAPPVKAVSIRLGKIYVSPDSTSAVVGEVRPGQDVAIFEHSGNFAHVSVHASGWMLNKGLVLLSDPTGPQVLLGVGSELEQQAETYAGQKPTAEDAARTFYRIFDDFPNSPLAAEGLYRAADIRWQLESRDLPTASDPTMRRFPEDDLLHKVKGKFPGTEWAARAAYILLDEHFTCGEWEQKPKCIDKEIDVYKDYLKQYPNSPLAAQATYNIVYREAAAWSVYSAEGEHHDTGKADEHRALALQWAADAQQRFPKTTWAARAAVIQFKVRDAMPVLGKEIP